MDRSKLYAWTVIALAAAVVTVLMIGAPPLPSLFTFLFWIALLAAAELLPVSLGYRTEVTMAFPILLAIAIVFRHNPAAAVIIVGLGAVDAREFRRAIPLHKSLFNRSLMVLSVGAALVPLSLGTNPLEEATGVLVIASAALAYVATNLSLLAVVVHLEHGIPIEKAFSSFIPPPIGGFIVSYVILTTLGVVTALAVNEFGTWAAAAILIPLLFARLSIIGARAQLDLSERIQRQQRALLEATEKVFQERESERNRIAEHIHDTSLQMLAAASYGTGNAVELLSSGDGGAAVDAMGSAQEAITSAMAGLRESLVDLRSSSIEAGGLMDTIRTFADQMGTLWRTKVRIEGGVTTEPPTPVALAAYQILQEGLANALKHGEGSQVVINVTEEEGMVHIVVKDEGAGFDPREEIGDDHHGMRLMKERAARVGGRIEIESKPGAGTRLEAILPGGVTQ